MSDRGRDGADRRPATDAGPRTLGKYRIDAVLGSGAMGVVYRGHDPAIKRTVAIKTILDRDLSDEDRAQFRRRFRVEARAAGRLTHPNIVAVHDVGEADGTAFIVMEFVAGRSLKEVLSEQERLPVPTAIPMLLQVLEALACAHDHGVIHRDIKPANILVTEDGQIKLADFGIARLDDGGVGRNASMVGTPKYMAPEQIMGSGATPATDIFAAGIVLYEMLTGTRPFTGSYVIVTQKVLREDPARPSEVCREIPASLDDVIAKALAKRPEQRFASAQAFAEALRSAVDPAQSVALEFDAFAPQIAPAMASGAGASPRPRSRRTRWAVIATATLLFLAIGIGAVAEWRRSAMRADIASPGLSAAQAAAAPASVTTPSTPTAPAAAAASPSSSTLVAPGTNAAEQRAWDAADRLGTADAFQVYLAAHPEGAHAAEARRRITTAPRHRPAADDAELALWDQAVVDSTPESYRRYLSAFPHGPHADQARRHLAQLEWAESARIAEQQDWDAVVAQGTPEGYRRYLQLHPAGVHAALARSRLAQGGLDAAGSARPSTAEPPASAPAESAYRDSQTLAIIAPPGSAAGPLPTVDAAAGAHASQTSSRYALAELASLDAAEPPAVRREVQEALWWLGHYTGPADGQPSERTRDAVRGFQRYEDAEPTGYLTSEQRRRLFSLKTDLQRLVAAPAASPLAHRPAAATVGAQQRYALAWQLSGNGRNFDNADAVYWLRLAAGEGHADALALLGHLYAQGITVAPDARAAEALWRAAGARGNAAALFNLGHLVESTPDGGRDRARHWYAMAAALGDQTARRALDRLGGGG